LSQKWVREAPFISPSLDLFNPTNTTRMQKNQTILLVEDDSVDVMTVKRAFKHLEIKNPLAVCNNGEEGLAWLNEHRDALPCLILLDLNMPKMNGLEFLKIVKADELLRMIPVVVLTTSEDQQDRVESFKLSVAGYMLKSFSFPKFLEVIGTIRTYWDSSEIA
jgi:CheY-like chemotaxis protein